MRVRRRVNEQSYVLLRPLLECRIQCRRVLQHGDPGICQVDFGMHADREELLIIISDVWVVHDYGNGVQREKLLGTDT